MTQDDKARSVGEKVQVGILMSLIVFFAVFGNTMVCIAVIVEERLRRLANYILASLALTDILLALLVMVPAISNDLEKRWVLGEALCNVWIFLDITLSTASLLNLCFITFDRWLFVIDPAKYETWMTTRKASAILASVWLASVLTGLPGLVVNVGPIHSAPETGSKGETTTIKHLKASQVISPNHTIQRCELNLLFDYTVITSSVVFYVPCIVLIYVYVRLFRGAYEKLRRVQVSLRNPTLAAVRAAYKDVKTATVVGAMIWAFLLCWLPFFIMAPIKATCDECISLLWFKVSIWFGYLNSCLNPFIYTIFSRRYRQAFSNILRLKYCRRQVRADSASSLIGSFKSERSSSKQADSPRKPPQPRKVTPYQPRPPMATGQGAFLDSSTLSACSNSFSTEADQSQSSVRAICSYNSERGIHMEVVSLETSSELVRKD